MLKAEGPRIERGFIPLSRVQEDQPLETVVFSLAFPSYVDQERIGVNMERIGRLQRLTGIRQITVTGNMWEESTGASSPTHEAHSRVINPSVPMSRRQVDLNIIENPNTISSKLADSKDGVRSPKGWARVLNGDVKQSIRKAGIDNLIFDVDPAVKFTYKFDPFFIAVFMGIILGVTHIQLSDALSLYPIGVVELYLLAKVAEVSRELQNPNFRNSLFYGQQFDRAMTLITLTATQKLIKDLHPDKAPKI